MSAYVDILIFAVIAAVLLWRLRSVLGERSEDDPPSIQNPFSSPVTTKANAEAALQVLPPQLAAAASNWASALPNYDVLETATAHHQLTPFLAIDPTFHPVDFIYKARKAFPLIVDAFAKGDKKTLEFLLSPALYKTFAAQIDRRLEKNETYTVQIHDVQKALITAAHLDGMQAFVTVDFTALQSVTHKDAEGNVLAGEDGHRETTVDRWVFSKDLKSADPKWILVKTEEID